MLSELPADPFQKVTVGGNEECSKQNKTNNRAEYQHVKFIEKETLLFDINRHSVEDKFELGLMSKHNWKYHTECLMKHCSDFKKWRNQSDYNFGFVPLSNSIMTYNPNGVGPVVDCPIQQHHVVNSMGLPNFLQARLPVKSELSVEELVYYWDKQLIDLVRFGFPLDFNRNSPLVCEMKNHTSAIQYRDHTASNFSHDLHCQQRSSSVLCNVYMASSTPLEDKCKLL